MTKQNDNAYHIKNFMELDKFLFNHHGEVDPVLFNKVMNGINDINNTHFNNREKSINLFLRDLFNNNPISSEQRDKLAWFNFSEYKEMIEMLKKDKDRAGTSALQDIKISKTPLQIENFDIFDELEKKLPNFSSVITYYRGAFAMNKTRSISNYAAPRPVLLLGEAGIGKTIFANTLAEILGTPYKFLDSNSISTSWSLSGYSPSWRGAEAGLIFKTLAQSDTISPVITLDEIDKLQTQNQQSPFSLFHQMFEKENSKRFYDEFLKFYFDASQIIYVLTANSINKIPESLLSRMEVFVVPNPNVEQMKTISQSIYQKEISGSSFFADSLDQEQLELLSTLKPREVQKMISNSINAQLSQNTKSLGKKEQRLDLLIKNDPRGAMGF